MVKRVTDHGEETGQKKKKGKRVGPAFDWACFKSALRETKGSTTCSTLPLPLVNLYLYRWILKVEVPVVMPLCLAPCRVDFCHQSTEGTV